jgi:DNA-binding NarL/FixJ family response regulator
LEATKQIRDANPRAKVLILSENADDRYVNRAIAVGVAGFIEKRDPVSVVSQGIRRVAEGERFLSAGIAHRLAARRNRAVIQGRKSGAPQPRLTHREFEVLQRVAGGWKNKQIAAALGISVKTLEKHRQRVMDKLDIHEPAGLTRFAIAEGLLENPASQEIVSHESCAPEVGD